MVNINLYFPSFEDFEATTKASFGKFTHNAFLPQPSRALHHCVRIFNEGYRRSASENAFTKLFVIAVQKANSEEASQAKCRNSVQHQLTTLPTPKVSAISSRLYKRSPSQLSPVPRPPFGFGLVVGFIAYPLNPITGFLRRRT